MLASVYAAIAVPFTFIRLYVRRHNLWWDDLCSVLSLVALLVFTACVIAVSHGVLRESRASIHESATYRSNRHDWTSRSRYPFKMGTPVSARCYICFHRVVSTNALSDTLISPTNNMKRFARVALVYSIIRITPSIRTIRFLHCLAASFTICGIIHILLQVSYCESHPSWKRAFIVICFTPRFILIFQITSTLCILFHPIRVHQNTSLNNSHSTQPQSSPIQSSSYSLSTHYEISPAHQGNAASS